MTRHAKPGSPIQQKSYASSGEFHQVLRANMVAKRAELVEDRELRELLWFIQYRSVVDLGLAKLVRELVETYQTEIGTAKMRELGCGEGRIYDEEEVKEVRDGFTYQMADTLFNDYSPWQLRSDEVYRRANPGSIFAPAHNEEEQWPKPPKPVYNKPLSAFPVSFPASSFTAVCIKRALAGFEDRDSLDAFLTVLCIDPKASFTKGLWYWPGVMDCLKDYRRRWCASRGVGMVETEINKRVAKEMGYCLHTGGLVVISGESRYGKTHGAQLFCERSGGMARYVEVPATNDEASFLRAIAQSLGLASGLGIRVNDLRERIEETFRRSDLALVLDEGHRMFPQRDFRQTIPQRLEWLMAGLINKGVACAIITTPQWFNAQRRMEERNFWNSAQLRGRISHYEELPSQIPPADMQAVARYLLPKACKDSLAGLVTAAEATQTYLAGMKSIVDRARYEAGGDPELSVVMAVAEQFIASNTSLTRASMSAPRRGRRRVSTAPATPLHEAGIDLESPRRDEAAGSDLPMPRGRGSDFELKLPAQRRRGES